MTETAHGPGKGLCRGCLRDLFLHGRGESTYCEACKLTIARHPDRDPRTIPNGRTEVLPQEMPVRDRRWDEGAACLDMPPELFEPYTMQNATVPEEIRRAAELCCARCPILERCRAEADEHEYLGLWGGQLRHYLRSVGEGRHVYTARDLIQLDDIESAA